MKVGHFLPGNGKTSEIIILILSEEWPLSLKQIHKRVRRKYGINVTAQAIHKNLKALNESRVLERENQGYKINIKWVESLSSFSENIVKSYSNYSAHYELKIKNRY